MNSSKSNGQYEALSPWAEVDPVPLRAISPRLTDLTGKKIGFFCNGKRAARPIMTVVEEKLKERFPTTEISWYAFHYNREVSQTAEKASFEEWVKGVDTVIAAIGD